ncbi:Tetratricopeptide repeat-containing protein [Terribacillus halophilus]|uniref:Tetratricopeptide repeat-containing protein n=1 Tax=Terribacillus halophilus TaxID=361279 RepID=A0A1G6SAQ0_9BACI|nr:tetratricopeptide repeat protein [Terribacillus halophilus]SDD13724.1 Tetratricopeptide repeat-containing protein [Terribacillus halophilus]
MDKENNVVLFPGLKTRLEQEGMKELQEKNYTDAIDKFEQLLDYGYRQPEILTGRLICLMELGRHEEAEEMSLQLLAAKDKDYLQYLHIHLTLLFQLGRYEEVVEMLDGVYANEKIPAPLKTSFDQLQKVSRKMAEDKSQTTADQLIHNFDKARKNQDAAQQWQLIQKCHSLDISPHVQKMEAFLMDEEADPVVQTAVLEWLIKQEIQFPVTIHKMKETITVIPENLTMVEKSEGMEQVLGHLHLLEQQNPSLYDLVYKLLYRYMYVRYPLMSTVEEAAVLAAALQKLASSYLQIEQPAVTEEEAQKIASMMEEIITFEAKYLTVAEE